MSATPGDAMRPFFSSQAAATKGSYNLAGIADPVIDALIEKILAAETRADLTIACRAFDRVFRAGRYWVPQWYRDHAPDRLLGSVRASATSRRVMRKASARRKTGGPIRPRSPRPSRRNNS